MAPSTISTQLNAAEIVNDSNSLTCFIFAQKLFNSRLTNDS